MTRRAIAPRSPSNRSRVSNGSQLLSGVDGRSALARRYRDLCSLLVSEAYGGEATEAQLQLVRRAASLSAWAEGQEALMASGATVDMAQFSSIANTLRRLLSDIGLTAVPAKPVTLEGHLASKRAAK